MFIVVIEVDSNQGDYSVISFVSTLLCALVDPKCVSSKQGYASKAFAQIFKIAPSL
jgi:hypothetical protein